MRRYTYDVCFFGEAHQKSNANHAQTSLGRFQGWSDAADVIKGSEAYYSKQVYADGQRCWNGPARSAHVDLVCGTTNALLSVAEPEKCTYLYKVATPAVCRVAGEGADVEAEGLSVVAGGKDEL